MKRFAPYLAILVLGTLLSCATADVSNPEQSIRDAYTRFSVAVEARDVNAIMTFYAPDVVAYDAFPPRQYVGAAAYRKSYDAFFDAFPGPVKSEPSDLTIKAAGTTAYAHGFDKWTATGTDGKPLVVVFRFTDVWRKIGGIWLVVHEHLSVPVDPVSGQGDFLSKP